jgi:hypothetical protein
MPSKRTDSFRQKKTPRPYESLSRDDLINELIIFAGALMALQKKYEDLITQVDKIRAVAFSQK